ncbi:uroporphyrinogen-III C-methyltransferase [Photobacterium sanguinicancri]|uniref:uroporphyrinogen-III C-methyltransferase n=1 Tax=Photobacterium sanguinicancri TaxID=875932 RepID=A0AAW7Y8Y9_9GAMM|nr:uroporphyrinogen-III C-methyltransferase [Photobacterium sanguinicancri]MDO6544211.1 uroporphyrinogen-III C-methyltransferase [Photobacterium sanguinicancri]
MTTDNKVCHLNLQSTIGKVILVGAGPGDPDLLTVKALRMLQQADVVVYDRLVSNEILRLIPEKTNLIFVGKQAGNHCVPQDGINQILVEQALKGQVVVRLKGGDPFIFGRGGEELEALLPYDIPFEVVPGITAAAGCAAYAGIPLTHRDHAQSVQFVTGHLKSEREQIDWSSLARSNNTLVFYMGLSQSGEIRRRLEANGMSPLTPAAIVERGTSNNQRVLPCSLETLEIIAAHAESPALIIIGSVTQLAHKLSWFEPKQSLQSCYSKMTTVAEGKRDII